MKIKTKKAVSLFLSFVFIFTSTAFTSLAEENTDNFEFKLYATNFNDKARCEINTNTPLEVWIGGGKSVYAVEGTGITVDKDSKAAVVELHAFYDGNSIDMTKGKNFFWLVAANADSVGTTTTAKPKNSNDYITLAAGKITAKTKTTPDGQYAYAGIYTYDKVTRKYTCHAVFPVVVKQAPAKLQINSIENSIAAADKVTSVSVGLNQTSQTVYINPLTSKNVKTGISLDSLSYKIELNNKNAEVILSDGTVAKAGEPVIIKADSSGNIGFQVKGLAITKSTITDVNSASRQDKTATSAVTVTNIQSGKNIKLTVTIGNNVEEVARLNSAGDKITAIGSNTASDALKLETYATRTTLDSRTLDLYNNNYIKANDSDGTITTAPVIGIYKAKTGSDGVYTYKDFISKDGKRISLPTTNKSDEITAALVGKDNYHIKISAKKKQDYEEASIHYVVLAYGTTENSILIIPVELTSPKDELTSIKIGESGTTEIQGVVKSTINVEKTGVYPDVIKLKESINNNGVLFSTGSKEKLAPTIKMTNGTYSTSTKKFKLEDNKQTILTLNYGTNFYYFTVNGVNYKSKALASVKVSGGGALLHDFSGTDNLTKTISKNDITTGVTIEFILSDGTKINPYSSELSYEVIKSTGSDGITFDRETSKLTGFVSGDEIKFTVKLNNVIGTNEDKEDKTYTITFTVGN